MKLLEQLNIPYRNEKLYVQAFTHTSYANEKGTVSYERLEYLGDTILDFVISEYLYKNMELKEGMMTKLRAHYVCEKALYVYASKLHFNDELLLGKGEEEAKGREKQAIIADVFESFVAALYFDLGLDEVKKFIYKYVIPIIEGNELDVEFDYKSILQELVQTEKKSLEYVLIEESGPAHDKKFTIQVMIDGINYGKGIAHSKKEAEQKAAKVALEKAQNGI